MKKILIVLALVAEIKEIKNVIKNLNMEGFEISYLVSGMNNYNMIYSLTKFLEKNSDFDFIINIGVCGYSFPHLEGELEGGYQMGRIKNIVNNKELIVPNFIDFSSIESIACSEKIIYNGEEIGEENFVDMESFGFEFVLEKINLPRLILKVPVDKIGEETKKFDFLKAKKYLRENIDYKKLFEKIGDFIDSPLNPPLQEGKNRIEKYFKNLNLTESQKNIFEKLYNKYEVLVGDDFENYLESSPLAPLLRGEGDRKLQKNDVKKFLKDLENYLEDK